MKFSTLRAAMTTAIAAPPLPASWIRTLVLTVFTVVALQSHVAHAEFCDPLRLTAQSESDQSRSIRSAISYALVPGVLGLTLETGSFTRRASQRDYQPASDDWIARNGLIRRGGRDFGQIAGRNGDLYLDFACPGNDPLQAFFRDGRADDPKIYHVIDPKDKKVLSQVEISHVWRKTKIVDTARLGRWDFDFILRHELALELSQPLPAGTAFAISIDTPAGRVVAEHVEESAALHASYAGFAPGDPFKAAYFSYWPGQSSNGGLSEVLSLADGTSFQLIDERTGATALEGPIVLDAPVGTPPALNASPVYRLEFSDFTRPGNYRVCIAGACSISFPISDNVWLKPFRTAMLGFFNQRSGMALGPPWTAWKRPRALHPDDGFIARQSGATLMDTSMGLNLKKRNSFEALREEATNVTVPGAWGGWHDAGDWDRRIQHLHAALDLLMLVELRPELASVELGIPESGDGIADIVDEALWSIDFYARLQKPDGGIPGGIESANHPQFGDSSWTERQDLFVYAPDPWSSWLFAAAAGRAARILRDMDEARSQNLAARAGSAFAWAEAHRGSLETRHHAIGDARNLATLELYRLTGKTAYHDLFKAGSSYRTGGPKRWNERQIDAGFIYAKWVKEADPAIAAHAREDIVARADYLLKTKPGGFGQIVDPHRRYGYSYTSTTPADAADVFVYTHALTGDDRYLKAIIAETLFGLGANPDNMSYMTGFGVRSPRAPLVVDMLALADKTPPSGITIFGQYDWTRRGHRAIDTAKPWMTPNYPQEWPIHEMYIGFPSFVPVSEYSIWATLRPVAFVLGYLAGRSP